MNSPAPKMLLFVRHAPTQPRPEASSHTWVLSEKGQEKCRQFASHLSPYHPTRIVTSEELKTQQTGQILAEQLHLPCQTAPDLHESKRDTAPWFETVDQFKSAVTQLFLQPEQCVFGEESAHEALTRVEDGVQAVLSQYPEDTLAIVTHGTVLSLLVAKYNEIDVVNYWRALSMPALVVVNLPNFQLQQTFNL